MGEAAAAHEVPPHIPLHSHTLPAQTLHAREHVTTARGDSAILDLIVKPSHALVVPLTG